MAGTSVYPFVRLSISSRHACHRCVLFGYFLSAFASSLRSPHGVFWLLLLLPCLSSLAFFLFLNPSYLGCLCTLGCEAFTGEWSALKERFSPSQQLSAANSFLGSNRVWLLAHLPLHARTLSGLSCADLMRAVTTAESACVQLPAVLEDSFLMISTSLALTLFHHHL